MTDDRPKPDVNAGGCVLCKAGMAQSLKQMAKANMACGRKVMLVTTTEDLNESLMA